MMTGVYDIANVGFTARVGGHQHHPDHGAYRGAGRPEAAAAIERAVDLFAAEIGIDPAEVRRRNLVARFADPYTTAIGTRLRRRRLRRRASTAPSTRPATTTLRAEQAHRRARRRRTLLGIGLSVYVEITAGPPAAASTARSSCGRRRRSCVTGSTPYGQGHVTAWAMLVADRTGIPHRAHRGRPRRHRRRPLRRADRRLAVAPGRRARPWPTPPPSWSRPRGSEPPSCSRPTADDVVLDRTAALPRRRHAGPRRRLGRGRRPRRRDRWSSRPT